MMRFDDKKFIAEQIFVHRRAAGLTQAQLAEMVELSVQHISRIESGHYIPSLKTFFMLASVLKLDLRIFGFDSALTEDNVKNKLIQTIISASKTELIFYENFIDAVNASIVRMKKELW
ncbi:MAG: helix-turn-helix transcriptional regulator [Candidatus Gastranaerophilales bacterium]|nr:helix-turn-helix transcriptional regulator [Candidatus Gastranaerophilales bacterium]MCM1072670.1 helix-turn-helix transcriptional regulator [Bacteroides sp.]